MTWRERSVLLNTQLQEQKQILRRIEQEFTIGRVDQRQIQQQKIKTNTTEISFRQGQVDALTQRVNLYLALGGSPIPQ
jgi:outer membrane protein TolC